VRAGSELPGAPRVTRLGLARAGCDVACLVLAFTAVIWAQLWVRAAVDAETVGFDFEGTLWRAGEAILDGRSPYPAPVVSEVDIGNPALYPPLQMILVAPLTVLPWWLGMTLWTAVLAGALALTLYALDVRDIRCYLLAFVSAPVAGDLVTGNATLLLVPLVALAWRWRERWLRCGVVLGLAVASKLLVWPLLFWLLGTRRYRAFGAALAAGGVSILLPWGAIGFDGLSTYPDVLRLASEIYGVHSYSLSTIASALGVETELAVRLAVAAGLAIAAIAFVSGRRGLDETSIALAVLAAILGSPIVWEYNYALLFVPIAIVRPRFSALWAVPLLMYWTHQLPRPRLAGSQLEPGGTACCRPEDVPLVSWVFSHAPPGLWPALGHAVLACAVVALVAWTSRRPKGVPATA
jgi:Glycosyltransferase family 87